MHKVMPTKPTEFKAGDLVEVTTDDKRPEWVQVSLGCTKEIWTYCDEPWTGI